MLIILPQHLRVSGVTTWALRAVAGLRARGRAAGLIIHRRDDEPTPEFLAPFVVDEVVGGPPIDAAHGRLDHIVSVYRRAVDTFAADDRPIVIAPNLHGDCYGAVAALAQVMPERIRVAAWIHADNNYDLAVARHYEPMLHAIVPVSRELADLARAILPRRAADVEHVAHGVPVPDPAPVRPPLDERPVRLLYAGRIDEAQKRITALPVLAHELEQRGVSYELRIVGDGEAMTELRGASKGLASVDIRGAAPPEAIPDHLAWADAWLLPSRYEGQSVAMLEAMGAGCTPIITRVRSGGADAVIHKERGLVVDVDPELPGHAIGGALADAVGMFLADEGSRLGVAARQFVIAHHTLDHHTDALLALIDRVVNAPPRPWPASRPAAFSAGAGGTSGSTPADAAARLEHALSNLAGERLLIYGAGRHTIDLASVFAHAAAEIIGIVDDHVAPGSRLWGWPVLSIADATTLGATDVVLSSAMHEEDLWSKSQALAAAGAKVHRLYGDAAV